MERLPLTRWLFMTATALGVAALLSGILFLYEHILQVLLAPPPHSLREHAVFLALLALVVTWLGFCLYGRVQQRTLEGVREVLTQAGVGIAMIDPRGRILWYNPAMARLFGDEGRSYVGRSILDRLREASATEAIVQAQKDLASLAAGQMCSTEIEVMLRDGRRVALSYVVSPLRGHRGHILGALSIFMDITERKRMAEELRSSHDNLRRLIEAFPAGVTVVDAASGRPVLWNQAARRMLGTPRELAIVGEAPKQFLFHGIRRVFDAQGLEVTPAESPLARTLRTRHPLSEQHHVLELEGGHRLDVAASTAFLETPEGGQAVLIFQDISGIQQLQRQLTAERVQAEKLAALLTTVATLNHEINNPLTGIFGSAELILMQPNLDAKVQRYAEKILELARRIDELLRSLSAATRFERREEKGFEGFVKVDRDS